MEELRRICRTAGTSEYYGIGSKITGAAQPRRQCEVYAFCGAYGSCNEMSLPFCNCLRGFERKSQSDWDWENYSGGCQRKMKLQCGNNTSIVRNGERDKSQQMSSISLPEAAKAVTTLIMKNANQPA
ncbi:hypothetical protein FNV43_RR13481 [Rhamnella rubrinervis]|uniref:S-locus glycoprotein domain-containing protein n=1 Tax=Rhamnella rubrinervis TaxID=2594499 RepID=A0A8K0H138_9ROSA|nr:hypothetical protein FNV43_RR13481 [Rhamnella rubrinervis]